MTQPDILEELRALSVHAEEWRAVDGTGGRYEVSNLGRVRSLWRRDRMSDRLRPTPLLLRLCINGRGRPVVRFEIDGVVQTVTVHRFVLDAFFGPCPDGMEASHIDGNRLNNRADNLLWETPLDNSARKYGHGTHQFGSRSPKAKLTEEKVLRVRALLAAGVSQSKIAREYCVARGTIQQIADGKSWVHVILGGEPSRH